MRRRITKEIVCPPGPSMVLIFQTIIIIQHLLAIRNSTMHLASGFTLARPSPTPSESSRTGTLYAHPVPIFGFYVGAKAGNPLQEMKLLIDTGSKITWANSVNSCICSNKITQSRYGGGCFGKFEGGKHHL